MKKKSSIKTIFEKTSKVEKVQKIKKVVENTQRIIGEVDNITKVISNTLYVRGNVAVDLQNYSLMSVSNLKDII